MKVFVDNWRYGPAAFTVKYHRNDKNYTFSVGPTYIEMLQDTYRTVTRLFSDSIVVFTGNAGDAIDRLSEEYPQKERQTE
jgi:cytolysin (calcineurin-like family phosphatase)